MSADLPPIAEKILDVLKKKDGLSYTEIVGKVKHSIATVSKYITLLEARGYVRIQEKKPFKLVFLE
jgi:DNA-binding IclR family transcriptional regulator